MEHIQNTENNQEINNNINFEDIDFEDLTSSNLASDIREMSEYIEDAIRRNSSSDEIISLRHRLIEVIGFFDETGEFDDIYNEQISQLIETGDITQIRLEDEEIVEAPPITEMSLQEFKVFKKLGNIKIRCEEECCACMDAKATHGYIHNDMLHVITCGECFKQLKKLGEVKCIYCNVKAEIVVETC